MIYLQLFFSFLQIGAFSFGGGYAAMPLIQNQVVERYGWVTMDQFSNLVAIAEMTPGPIAVNGATFVGNQVGGIPGALIATFAVILPSIFFVTFLAHLYLRYKKVPAMQRILGILRPVVIASIFNAGLLLFRSAVFANEKTELFSGNLQYRELLIFIVAIILLRKMKIDPIKVIFIGGLCELAAVMIER